jgi:hypothetical protein
LSNILDIKPVDLDTKILNTLEKKKLIRTFRPSRYMLGTKPRSGRVDRFYRADPCFGGHKVIGIGLDNDRMRLNWHPENEEFVFVKDPGYICKSVYLVIGLAKAAVIEKRAKTGTLRAKDIMLIRWPYNDPRSLIFTMLKGTPHCEITLPGRGNPAIFYVTEPSRLKMNYIKMSGYKIQYTV